MVYKVKEGDKLVSKKEVVNPDAQGRYIFKVPEELDVDSGLTITGEFIDNGNKDVEADDTQTQVTGVVSVAVVNNDNQALIDAGAQVTAGGSVTAKAVEKTDVSTLADGTAASKEEEGEKKAKDNDAIKRPKAKQYSGYDARGLTYGLILDGTQNGAVTFEKDDDRRFYTYTFTPEPVEGYSVAGATVTFYEDGKLKTEELEAKDGKYAIDLEALSMDKGSTALVSFAFAREGVYGEAVSTQEAQAVIANPIRFSYNALKDDEEDEVGDKVGQIKYDSAREDEDGRVTAYLFEAEADGDAGYELDGKLKSGTLKAVITADDGSYTEEVYMARQDDETYSFIMPADIDDPTKVKVSFKGEFEPGQSDTSAVDTSLGAGVSVTVSNSDNRAVVAGTVKAGGSLETVADIEGGVSTESKAGYSKGNTGVGGAVSVQVASMDSKAMIKEGADVALGGDLNIEANSEIEFGVKADASGSEEAEKVGVGAGIAVAVNASQVFAGIQDGAKLATNDAGETSITAVQKAKDTVSAKAGAAGGTAVVPVASVDVTAVSADAYLGRVSGKALDFSDNAALSASSEVTHNITADASTAGKSAGIGAAIGVSVIDDAARARLNQSLSAAQLTVASELISSVTENITASASGGEAEGESPDAQADGLMGGAAKIAGNNRSGGVSAGKIDKASKDRQKSETSEGTVGVAGAVAVNEQSSESRAEIMNGVNVHTEGLTAVTAQNGTRAKIKANASTTNSDIGVGVGVAINVINLINIANMGDGEFEAAMIRVAATTKESMPEEEPETFKVETEDELAEQLGEAVKGYIEDVIKEMGLDKYVSADLLSGIVESVVNETANELIDATGLQELLGDGNLKDKYEKAVELLKDGKDGLFGRPVRAA